ncbi:hypothetical protein BG000_001259 [Podila horticola]|nr:hypothetical protein BG000_001259 [Podila horticola]
MSAIAKEILTKSANAIPLISQSARPKSLYRALKVMDGNGVGETVGFSDCYYKVTSVQLRGAELTHGRAYGVEVWKGKVLNEGKPVEIRGGLKWNWVKCTPTVEHITSTASKVVV